MPAHGADACRSARGGSLRREFAASLPPQRPKSGRAAIAVGRDGSRLSRRTHQTLHDRAAEAGLGWSLDSRLAVLELAVPAMSAGQDIVLIGRSSGARVMTLFASRRPVTAVICMAYPFKHPNHDVEPDRFAHLAALATPTLIIQGLRDDYGGLDVMADYPLSSSIRLEFFDGDHEFVAGAEQCAHIPQRIHAFAQ